LSSPRRNEKRIERDAAGKELEIVDKCLLIRRSILPENCSSSFKKRCQCCETSRNTLEVFAGALEIRQSKMLKEVLPEYLQERLQTGIFGVLFFIRIMFS